MKNKIKRFLEEAYPYLLGLIMVVIFMLSNIQSITVNRLELILNSVITVSITVVGFFITMVTILIGLVNKRVMKVIKKYKGDKLLANYFLSPIIFGSILVLYCFYLAYIIQGYTVYRTEILIFLFIVTIFIIGCIRIGYILLYILRMVLGEPDSIISDADLIEKSKPDQAFNKSISNEESE